MAFLPSETTLSSEVVFESAVSASDDVFALRFFPVFDIQRHIAVALFCRPMVDGLGTEAVNGHEAFRAVSPQQLVEIDCAILEEAVTLGERLGRAGIAVVVGASLSFATLSDPRARHIYRDALRAVTGRERTPPLIKIEDIPERTGANRIGELVQCLKPLTPRVWVHLPGSHLPLAAPLHARGFVLSMPPMLPLHGMEIEARWLARQGVAHGVSACMDRVSTAAELDAVRTGGVRFAAGPALRRRALEPRATLEEIRETLYATDGAVQ